MMLPPAQPISSIVAVETLGKNAIAFLVLKVVATPPTSRETV